MTCKLQTFNTFIATVDTEINPEHATEIITTADHLAELLKVIGTLSILKQIFPLIHIYHT